MFVALTLVAPACASTPATTGCPGHFDPSEMSDAELRRQELGKIPERGSTSRETVTDTVALRRSWIEENYRGVETVAVGEGWGVTYTNDELGNKTFHRGPDHIIVATLASRGDCPDPERGTLLVFSSDGKRVPVRFVFRLS